jgi:hypothetical protein
VSHGRSRRRQAGQDRSSDPTEAAGRARGGPGRDVHRVRLRDAALGRARNDDRRGRSDRASLWRAGREHGGGARRARPHGARCPCRSRSLRERSAHDRAVGARDRRADVGRRAHCELCPDRFPGDAEGRALRPHEARSRERDVAPLRRAGRDAHHARARQDHRDPRLDGLHGLVRAAEGRRDRGERARPDVGRPRTSGVAVRRDRPRRDPRRRGFRLGLAAMAARSRAANDEARNPRRGALDGRRSAHSRPRPPDPARDGAAPNDGRRPQGDGRHHEPDALRRRAQVRPPRASTSSRNASRTSRAMPASRSTRTCRSRALCTRSARSETKSPRRCSKRLRRCWPTSTESRGRPRAPEAPGEAWRARTSTRPPRQACS